MQPGELPPVQMPDSNIPHAHKKALRFAKLRAWIKENPKMSVVYGFGVLAILILAGTGIYSLLFPQTSPSSLPVTAVKTPTPTVYHSPLTGVEVADESTTKLPVTGIMIENSPDARPQSGLKEAGIVYEAIAEGGITRFLALYQEAKPSLIGPVRSVRMYYVDWVAPYDASIAHIGGSAAALKEVRNGNYRDLDQFFNANYYWRATDRYAPHNVYTNFEKLDALNAAKGYTTSSFTSWPRQDGKASDAPNATSVTINFSSALFNTQYAYDAATNTYARSIGGVDSNDREKGRLTPNVVIAMQVDMSLVMEDGYRESISTTGTGKATIFQNGIAQDATWKKADRASPLQFFDANGNEIAFNRGQTWVAAVPNDGGSVSWQ